MLGQEVAFYSKLVHKKQLKSKISNGTFLMEEKRKNPQKNERNYQLPIHLFVYTPFTDWDYRRR